MTEDELQRRIALAESMATFYRLVRESRFSEEDIREFEAIKRRENFKVIGHD